MRAWHLGLALVLLAATALILECGSNMGAWPEGAAKIPPDPRAAASAEDALRADLQRAEIPSGEELGSADSELDLRGIVLDSSGAPLDQVSISALLQLDRQRPGRQEAANSLEHIEAATASDSEGRFRLRLRPYRVYDLRVHKAGYAQLRLSNLYAGEEQRIILTRSASIAGRIFDARDGTPIEGVLVKRKQRFVIGPVETTVSRQDGAYRFDDLSVGEFELVYQSATHVSRYGVQVQTLEGETAREDVGLDRGTSIHGRVRDGTTGEPIGGAELRIFGQAFAAITSADGSYRLEGVPLELHHSIRIRAAGYGEYDYPIQFVPEEGMEQDFGLLRGRTAHGRVVDRDGTPVAGTDVIAFAWTSQSRYGNWQMDRSAGVSAGDGRFMLADLRVDLRHTLLLCSEGRATMVYDFPESEWAAQEIELGDLILEAECTIAGVAEDPDGRPLPDLWVSLSGEPWRRDALGPATAPHEGYASDSGLGFGSILARTDARGRFAFAGLPAGAYSLSAGKKGILTGASEEVEILLEGEEVNGVRLVLDPSLSIAGTVVDASGRPVSGSVVSIAPADAPMNRLTYAIANPDGSFRLAGLDAGLYSLTVDAGFHESNAAGWTGTRLGKVELQDVPAGSADLSVVLPRGAEISGLVLGPDRAPVANANVWFFAEGSQTQHDGDSTDGEGRFSLWVNEGMRGRLTALPPLVVQQGQRIDTELLVTVPGIAAGDTGLVVHLPRLP